MAAAERQLYAQLAAHTLPPAAAASTASSSGASQPAFSATAAVANAVAAAAATPTTVAGVRAYPAITSAGKAEGFLPGEVLFRALAQSDLEQCRALHSILFPVRYGEWFFSELFQAHASTLMCFACARDDHARVTCSRLTTAAAHAKAILKRRAADAAAASAAAAAGHTVVHISAAAAATAGAGAAAASSAAGTGSPAVHSAVVGSAVQHTNGAVASSAAASTGAVVNGVSAGATAAPASSASSASTSSSSPPPAAPAVPALPAVPAVPAVPASLCNSTCALTRLIGVATGRMTEEGGGWTTAAVRTGYISTLGVAPDWRHCGLGAFLLRSIVHLLQSEQRVARIQLHVLATNAAAIHMYTRNGFVVRQRLEEHYSFDGGRHDALHVVYAPLEQRLDPAFDPNAFRDAKAAPAGPPDLQLPAAASGAAATANGNGTAAAAHKPSALRTAMVGKHRAPRARVESGSTALSVLNKMLDLCTIL